MSIRGKMTTIFGLPVDHINLGKRSTIWPDITLIPASHAPRRVTHPRRIPLALNGFLMRADRGQG
jgi:hypothetical protein